MRRIRNGVVAIDSVTTAPNSDAASGRISCAAVAWANRTKPNSPAWLSSRPSRSCAASCCRTPAPSAGDQDRLGDDHRRRDAEHEQRPLRDQAEGRAASRPTGRTGRAGSSGTARRRFPAHAGRAIRRASRRRRTRPAATDRCSACISAAEPTTVNRPATTNSSRSPSRPTSRNSGLSTSRPTSTSADDRSHRVKRQRPADRRARVGRGPRHRRDDRDHRHDRRGPGTAGSRTRARPAAC